MLATPILRHILNIILATDVTVKGLEVISVPLSLEVMARKALLNEGFSGVLLSVIHHIRVFSQHTDIEWIDLSALVVLYRHLLAGLKTVVLFHER